VTPDETMCNASQKIYSWPCGVTQAPNNKNHVLHDGTVEPLFSYSIGQKWLYLLQKVLKLRYGFP
jgi:hypothetical protein